MIDLDIAKAAVNPDRLHADLKAALSEVCFGLSCARMASRTGFCENGPSTMISSLDAIASSCSDTICAQYSAASEARS
jgi:hypothetical protein